MKYGKREEMQIKTLMFLWDHSVEQKLVMMARDYWLIIVENFPC